MLLHSVWSGLLTGCVLLSKIHVGILLVNSLDVNLLLQVLGIYGRRNLTAFTSNSRSGKVTRQPAHI